MNASVNIYKKGIDLLSRREHSRKELERKLMRYTDNSVEVQQVLDRLTERAYQSDTRFTEAYIHSRIARGYGIIRISLELKDKGIATETIQSIFTDINYDWIQLAEQVRIKRFGVNKNLTYQEKIKQIRFLQYKGFTQEQINQIFIC